MAFRAADLLANPNQTPFDYFLRSAKEIAPSLAIELVPSLVESAADVERSIESFALMPNGRIVLLPSNVLLRDLIITLAARYRLPAIYPFRFFAPADEVIE